MVSQQIANLSCACAVRVRVAAAPPHMLQNRKVDFNERLCIPH